MHTIILYIFIGSGTFSFRKSHKYTHIFPRVYETFHRNWYCRLL